jgi:predicted nuclease with TOPRIM domain
MNAERLRREVRRQNAKVEQARRDEETARAAEKTSLQTQISALTQRIVALRGEKSALLDDLKRQRAALQQRLEEIQFHETLPGQLAAIGAAMDEAKEKVRVKL